MEDSAIAYRTLNHDVPVHSEDIGGVNFDFGETNYFITYKKIETGNEVLKPVTLIKVMTAWNPNSASPGTNIENDFQINKQNIYIKNSTNTRLSTNRNIY